MTEETKMVEVKSESKPSEVEIRYRIEPTHHLTFNEDSNEWVLEVHLPGVSKDKVSFKVLADAYFLEARREHALFTLSEYFPFDIDVASVQGKYENGLLIINGKMKDPLAEAVNITLK